MASAVFDAHAHLDEAPPAGTPLGISGWILPGVSAARDADSAALAAADSRLVAAAGLHPWYLPDAEGLDDALRVLQSRIDGGSACAVGETGLDKGRRAGPREVQLRAFRAQLAMAARASLPLILHVVRSHGRCLEEIAAAGSGLGGMVHDFQGPLQMVGPWVQAGFLLSISPRGRDKDAVIAAIPAEHLLLETDDEGWQQLPELCALAAGLRGVAPAELAAQTEANARRLFGK
jgi:TatD DNase family protein